LIPINFLGSFKNRFTIAATFGATASTFFTNARSGLFTLPGPAWLTVFNVLISVLTYGILFYPFFACLTTEYKLVGSLLGFLYVSIRFSFKLVIDLQCKSSYEENLKIYQYLELLGEVPSYLCLLFIAMRFGVLLFLEVRHKWFKCTSERRGQARADDDVACLIEKQGIIHVEQLLNPALTSSVAEEKWYTRLIYRIYRPRGDFKFSAQLISTLVVAAIIVFQSLIDVVAELEYLKRTYLILCDNDSFCDTVVRLGLGSLQGGYIVAAFFSILILLHFMKCHRDHIFQLYRGQMTFSQDVFVSPARLVGRSLRFSGYQIAYVFTGNVVMGFFMAVIALILGFIFRYAKEIFSAETLTELKGILIAMLPTVGMAISLWAFQKFLELFAFRDRDFPNIAITVDNKRLFSIMAYFFFFYNILLGVFSCLVRILKGMLLGVVFLSRIDRTSMMQGFQTWDQAFVAYLGFIHLLVAHSHPVMLMFCQLLISRNKDRTFQESLEQAPFPELRLPRMSQQAINRWFLAVTLLRNPSLIKYRRQGVVRPIVRIHGSINDDSAALI